MSLFGTKLRALMSARGFNLDYVEKVSGLSKSTISEICTGVQITVSLDNVERILRAFHDDKDDGDVISLALAHLGDETAHVAKTKIAIQPVDAVELHDSLDHRLTVYIDPEFEEALSRIRQAIPKNADLRLCLIDLANAVCATAKQNTANSAKGQSQVDGAVYGKLTGKKPLRRSSHGKKAQ